MTAKPLFQVSILKELRIKEYIRKGLIESESECGLLLFPSYAL